jgi:hypothetical protein
MTSAFPFMIGDPYYEDKLSRWLRRSVTEYHGISILVDDTLNQNVAASQQEEAIWVRPGMPLAHFHRAIGEAVRFIKFGEIAAPSFVRPRPRPHLAASNGLIVPEHYR